MDRKYMNLDELKDFLGVNHQTVYNFRRLWGLPYIKIGSVVRYDRDEVIAWMASHSHVDSSEAAAVPAAGIG
ncbi:helix-turn-helix domain-containing protein [bacterium]|nr:helix-turn-helix domain-containing protein [bacterium]